MSDRSLDELIARMDDELLDAERRRLARIVRPSVVQAGVLGLLDDEAERRAAETERRAAETEAGHTTTAYTDSAQCEWSAERLAAYGDRGSGWLWVDLAGSLRLSQSGAGP